MDHLEGPTLEDRFAAILRDRVWSAEGSVSGPGSDSGATADVQDNLARLQRELGASQVTDVGCGDFGWMNDVEGDFRYYGVDIVSDLIAELTRTYGNATRRFLHLDAARDALPNGDVVLLSFADGPAVLRNLRDSRYRCLISTSDGATGLNADIPSGDYRPLNFAKRPFGFPATLRTTGDDRILPGRLIAVWRLADLPCLRHLDWTEPAG